VVDCSHATEEKKNEEQANQIKNRNEKTGEKDAAQQTGEASEEGDQEETIQQGDILEIESGPEEQSLCAPLATVGVFG
jgi:hypothetical protein